MNVSFNLDKIREKEWDYQGGESLESYFMGYETLQSCTLSSIDVSEAPNNSVLKVKRFLLWRWSVYNRYSSLNNGHISQMMIT
jgi:hypothetical protein